jgi:LysM repeat protein
MLDRILSPFIGYWYWAQDRETPLTKGLALAAPLVVFGLVLYMLFGRGGDGGSSLLGDITATQGNIAAGTPTPPVTAPTQPASTGVGAAPTTTDGQHGASATVPAAQTAGPAPTAFTQQRYTVASGDTPGGIAEKLGVPADIRDAWIDEMLALNGVPATGLQIGQELILPPF